MAGVELKPAPGGVCYNYLMDISVIIPTLNESDSIRRAIDSIGAGAEIIVVDGGSTDSTLDHARNLGARILLTDAGRGLQMDSGAESAAGDVLLFLHADTILPPGWSASITTALGDAGVVAGGFSLSIDSKLTRFRLIEYFTNLRSKSLGLIYGDQAIFARKSAFFEAGGFGKLPLMEDVDCVKKLGRLGRVVTLDDSVLTSPRRWSKGGVFINTVRNSLLLGLWYAGVSPESLYRLYYGQPAGSGQG